MMAAAESRARKDVVERLRFVSGELGDELPLEMLGEIGAGKGAGAVEMLRRDEQRLCARHHHRRLRSAYASIAFRHRFVLAPLVGDGRGFTLIMTETAGAAPEASERERRFSARATAGSTRADPGARNTRWRDGSAGNGACARPARA